MGPVFTSERKKRMNVKYTLPPPKRNFYYMPHVLYFMSLAFGNEIPPL